MTASTQDRTAAEFDLVIGDLEVEIPELDDTVASLTDGHTNPSCSGLLQIAVRMALETDDHRYDLAAGTLAARILDAYDSDVPFGFRYPQSIAPRPADRPGFLDGAAGVALALHTYATGRPPRTSWDAALLLT